jgi:hypothetical protein
MRRRRFLPTVVVTAVLLPGLVMAAPIAGPCGRCGDDTACQLQQPAQAPDAAHACCETGRTGATPEPSLASSSCECGREAPPATLGGAPSMVDGSAIESDAPAAVAVASPILVAGVSCRKPPAPPPSPSVFLIDCAFLT